MQKKIERIRNNSSIEEFEEYKLFLSKSNEDSPLKFFNKDVRFEINILDFEFVRPKYDSITKKALQFIAVAQIPKKAKVKYRLTKTDLTGDVVRQNFVTLIDFTFSGIGEIDKIKQDNIAINVISTSRVRITTI